MNLNTKTLHTETTLQEENFHANVNFAISLAVNSLNLNSANYRSFKNLSKMD